MNLPKVEKYEHHGVEVSVISAVKGKHRDHNLCYSCAKFTPEDRENNCPISNAIYKFVVEHDLVTPTYECPKYEVKEEKPE